MIQPCVCVKFGSGLAMVYSVCKNQYRYYSLIVFCFVLLRKHLSSYWTFSTLVHFDIIVVLHCFRKESAYLCLIYIIFHLFVCFSLIVHSFKLFRNIIILSIYWTFSTLVHFDTIVVLHCFRKESTYLCLIYFIFHLLYIVHIFL